MARNKKVIEGPEIKIIKPLGRFEIVKRVVFHFIEFEKDKKGKGIEFRYPVEELFTGEKLYIHRPGVKWNFDFKVEIPPNSGLKEGKHNQIALLLRSIKNSNEHEFNEVWKIIRNLYHCTNNDVDEMLKQAQIPKTIDNIIIDILLKVIKWLFIMENVIYWHYEGRAFLYNFLKYVIYEEDKERLKDVLKKKIKPHKIKKLLGKNWEEP